MLYPINLLAHAALLALTMLFVVGCQTAHLNQDADQLTLVQDGRPILSYNAALVPSPVADAPWYGRSGFLHPVYSPKGHVVTEAFPEDHRHHHGLMFAWTSAEYQGQRVDFWNSQKKQGIVEHVKTLAVDRHTIKAELRHVITTGQYKDTVVLNETWTITRVPHETLNVFDLVSVQTCTTDKPLVIREHNYGGMCVRGPDHWNNTERMLTNEGKGPAEGNHTRPNWVALFGPAAEGRDIAGIAAMGHPDNFRSAQPVRLHPEMSYFCFAPMVAGDFQITPGEPYVSKFRFVTYDGRPDAAELDAVWRDYVQGRD